jgi:hypothetical protein
MHCSALSSERWNSRAFSSRAARGGGLVRLKAHLIGEVKVLSGKYAHQPVAECNCVVVRRGGEQQEANDPSVG